jgi:8-oxo-dGTP diphosphatase
MKKYPKVGVGVIIKRNNKVLLGKRKGEHGNGTWAPPGGHLEFNESFEDCAKREVLEETSLKIKNISFATVTNNFYKNENKHYVTIFMLCDWNGGEAKITEPDRCSEWKWCSWNNMPKPLFLALKNLLGQGYNPFK